MNIDYKKLKPEQVKEKLKELYDENSGNLYSKGGYTLEDFKTKVLEGYTCN